MSDGATSPVVFPRIKISVYPSLALLCEMTLSPYFFTLPIKATVNTEEREGISGGESKRRREDYTVFRSLKGKKERSEIWQAVRYPILISGGNASYLWKLPVGIRGIRFPSIHEFPAERYPYAKENYGPHRSTPGNNRSRFEHISNDRVLDSRLNFSEEERGEEERRKKMKKREKETEASSA